MVFARVDLCCTSGCWVGGGMDFFSNASRCASIFVSTDTVRATASSCAGVIGTGPDVDCLGPLSSVPSLERVGGAGAFFFRQGVGEGSTQIAGWDSGVESCPCAGAGEVEVVCLWHVAG